MGVDGIKRFPRVWACTRSLPRVCEDASTTTTTSVHRRARSYNVAVQNKKNNAHTCSSGCVTCAFLKRSPVGRMKRSNLRVCHVVVRCHVGWFDGMDQSVGPLSPPLGSTGKGCDDEFPSHLLCMWYVVHIWRHKSTYLGALRVKLSPTKVTLVTMRFHDLAAMACVGAVVCCCRWRAVNKDRGPVFELLRSTTSNPPPNQPHR